MVTTHTTPEGIIFRSSYSTAEVFFDAQGVWHIAGLWTRKDFRGHGHAGRLLRYVLAEADKEGKTVTVSLDTDNPDLARKKYISLGFTTKGSTRNHYMIRIPSKHP